MAGILRNSFPSSLTFYEWQEESFHSAQRQPGGVHLLEQGREGNVHEG